MKKHVKFTALVLVCAMMASLCACTISKGSGIVRSDDPFKPEYGMATEPTGTKSPSGTDYDMTSMEAVIIAEACIGLSSDAARDYLTGVFGIVSYNETSTLTYPSGLPKSFYLRDLDVDIYIEGYLMKTLGVEITEDDVVSCVSYSMRSTAIKDTNEELDSKEAYDTIHSAIYSIYGSPDPDYSKMWITFTECGQDGWKDGDNEIYLFWGKGCENVKGNDQFVFGVESYNPGGPTGGRNTPTPTEPATTTDTPTPAPTNSTSDLPELYEMMHGIIGADVDTAKAAVEKYLGISLGDATVETDNDGTTYTYSVKFEIDGVKFDEVYFSSHDDGKSIAYVSFINVTGSADTLKGYVGKLNKDLESTFGAPFTNSPLSDTQQTMELYKYKDKDGHVFSIIGFYTGDSGMLMFDCEGI